MPLSTIGVATTKYKNLAVKLNDITLSIDDVINIDILNSFYNFGLKCNISFKDSYSITNSDEIRFDGSTVVSFTVFDFMQNRRQFTFVTYDMEIYESRRVKIVTLKLIDPFAYKLQNTYVPKSFNCSIVDAFQDIVKNYEFESELQKNGLSLDCSSSEEREEFVIGSNQNIMEYFTQQFRLKNIRMWQDNKKVYVKEFKLGNATINERPYKTTATNGNYLYKIHDMVKQDLKKSNVPNISPLQEVVRFRNKTVIRDTINLTDFYSDILLNGNDDLKNIQMDATGKSFSTFNDSVEAQKYDLFDTFMHNELLDIVVPGDLNVNHPGRIINVQIGDNSPYIQARQKGDRTSSGKWFIGAVQSKLFCGRFIQRLRLGRFDHPRV